MHCYNFTPSPAPAVTAPHSLICGHLKKTAWTVFTEHFDLLSSVGEDVDLLVVFTIMINNIIDRFKPKSKEQRSVNLIW